MIAIRLRPEPFVDLPAVPVDDEAVARLESRSYDIGAKLACLLPPLSLRRVDLVGIQFDAATEFRQWDALPGIERSFPLVNLARSVSANEWCRL